MNTPGLLIGPSPFSSFWICISFLKQLLLTPLFPNYYRLFLFTFSLGTQNFFFNFLSEKVFVYRIYLFFFSSPPLSSLSFYLHGPIWVYIPSWLCAVYKSRDELSFSFLTVECHGPPFPTVPSSTCYCTWESDNDVYRAALSRTLSVCTPLARSNW